MTYPDFRNEPHINWRKEENRGAMRRALTKMQSMFPIDCPALIGGKEYRTSTTIVSLDPADTKREIGHTYETAENPALMQKAEQVILSAWQKWRARAHEDRAEILLSCAAMFREKKFEFAALMAHEVSKPWDEAMSEVEEAIDFIELYVKEFMRVYSTAKERTRCAAEKDYVHSVARGPTAAISTWNFPLALSVEKIAASLMCGCPVFFKPAEQAPVIGYELARCLFAAGVPEEVVTYLPGTAKTGERLVRSPHVAQITFTGSREVGDAILQTAYDSPGNFGPKRVDIELGGNNPMILCPSAVMDQAVSDSVSSKFGFSGQKCSALQRLIIVGKPEQKWVKSFKERLWSAAESIEFGHPQDPRFRHASLIDEDAYLRAHKHIESIYRLGAQKVLKRTIDVGHPHHWMCAPAVFEEAPHDFASRHEMFAPILFIYHADSLEQALEMANETPFALTAGIHTELESEQERFLKVINAGNVYVNRAITGAIVNRQPFGGYKHSGFGEKVGCAERLRFFLNMQSVSINQMRHGSII